MGSPRHAGIAFARPWRAILTLLCSCLLLAACGSGAAQSLTSANKPAAHAKPAKARATHVPRALVYRPLFSLAAAVQDPAVAALGAARFVAMGGVTAEVTSTANVLVADPHGVVSTTSLPGPQHDAQAANLGGQVYVFGGGEFTQYDHILRFDPGANAVTQVGTLPTAQSDVAVAAVGGTAYVVGGFDGTSALNTIVAWSPGSQPRVVARMPVALRYAAVASAGSAILIIGGSTPTGASDMIYRFVPASGAVTVLGHLPQATTHAGAATLGPDVYLAGGRGDSLDGWTDALWAINPATGAVRSVGHLPAPLSDAGVVAVNGRIIVIGGHSSAGTQATVGELVPVG